MSSFVNQNIFNVTVCHLIESLNVLKYITTLKSHALTVRYLDVEKVIKSQFTTTTTTTTTTTRDSG